MSRQSNTYTIVFSLIMAIIVGGSLSGISVALKDKQKESIELDKRKSILMSVMTIESGDDVLALYDSRIESYVVDNTGATIDGAVAEDINVEKQYKNYSEAERQYPVFVFKNEAGDAEAYIFPIFGAGLWDAIWGFVALETDLNTIKGISLDHRGETPGLGARITSPEVQERYAGQKIYSEAGELVSVAMLKGEGNGPDKLSVHLIDGMSGATITGRGVNDMLLAYLEFYEPFMQSIAAGGATAEVIEEVVEVETVTE